MIRNLVLLVVIAGMAIPAAAVCMPWFLLTGNLMPLYNVSFFIVRVGFRIAGIRVEAIGLENIPADKACIFMANHVSNLDPPVLTSVIPGRTSVFYKQSLSKIPILGHAMRLAEFVPVKRESGVDSARESARLAKGVLAKGIPITTFVEGTRSRDGRLLPFKKGPFYLGMESGAPCVPVSISGTEQMMHKGSSRVLPGVARVVFHPPIYPEKYTDRDSLMLAVRESIAAGLPEWMREASGPVI